MTNSFLQNPHLDGSTFFFEGNNDVCVILLHGFTSTSIEVRPLAEFINKAGYNVLGPLLPGHGTQPEDLNKCIWSDWINSILTHYYKCKEKYRKVFVGGESMGGVLTCYLAANEPDIKGIMLYAPAIKVERLGHSRYIRFFKKQIPKSNINENENETYPWQGYTVHPTRAAYQFYLLQQKTSKLLRNIKQPAIIFQGKFDTTISPDSPNIVYDQIQSSVKELVFLENSGHCVLLEKDFDYVTRKTLEFLRSNE